MRRTLSVLATSLMLALAGIWLSCGHESSIVSDNPRTPVEGDAGAASYDWAIGPIEGITTAWHEAPREISVPVGTVVPFKCGMNASADVTWSNAPKVRTTRSGPIASYRFDAPGRYEIKADIALADGHEKGKERPQGVGPIEHSCLVIAIPTQADPVVIESLKPRVVPPVLNESSSNYETMRAFFSGHISPLRQTSATAYRTSVGTPITLDVALADPRFASLVETRISGQRPVLGAVDIRIDTPGDHTVSVGPPGAPLTFKLQTFNVEITSHHQGREVVNDGVPTTFVARTIPPGFEDDITWLASTKFGEAKPVLGSGRTFTVTFKNTSINDAGQTDLQWLGVKADNVAITQDLPAPVITSFAPSALSTDGVVTIQGDNFPLDPANISLEFLKQSVPAITLLGVTVVDTDADGFGEQIQGTVGPIPDGMVGQSVQLTLEEGNGAVSSGRTLFHHDPSLDLVAVSPGFATFASGTKRNLNATVDADSDIVSYDFAVTAQFPAWMANKNYKVWGTITIVYKLPGESAKKCSFSTNAVQFTSDANPTSRECAQASVDIFQSALNLAPAGNPSALFCKNNFEVKRSGTRMTITKKAGSLADILTGATFNQEKITTGGKIEFECP